MAGRACGVEQHVGEGGCFMPELEGVQVRPPSVETPMPPVARLREVAVTPHLGAGQVVDSAECAPEEALDLGVEGEPVGCVAPCLRDAVGGGLPGCAAVVAGEEADVGVVDEDVLGSKGSNCTP